MAAPVGPRWPDREEKGKGGGGGKHETNSGDRGASPRARSTHPTSPPPSPLLTPPVSTEGSSRLRPATWLRPPPGCSPAPRSCRRPLSTCSTLELPGRQPPTKAVRGRGAASWIWENTRAAGKKKKIIIKIGL